MAEVKEAHSYAAPRSFVSDVHPGEESARPTLVWVILGFQVFALVGTLILKVIARTGALPLSPAEQRLFNRGSSPELLLTTFVFIAWMIQFWRLRRSAPYIFTLLLLYNFAFHVIPMRSAQVAIAPIALLALAIRWSINLSICAYAWNLWHKRVLK